jgi:hypothetical protein
MVQTAGIRAGHLPARDRLNGVLLIIVAGVAGALDPTLSIGDVVLDDPDHRLPDSPLYRRGRIHTASQIAATPVEKTRLFQETNALAVDMEQAIIAELVRPLGIPVIGLRAISDTADQSLDPAVMNLVDDLGRPKPMKIAATLIRRPGLVPHLMKLNTNTRIALKNLSRATSSIIQNVTQAGV